MAIDYIIDYDCPPKQAMGTPGILDRLKGKQRAETIIQLYRQNGDDRPPTDMGFEMTRTAADGREETQVVVVQHLLDYAAELQPFEQHCQGCPANRTDAPFGCMGRVDYPITGHAEAWMLKQLPSVDETLVWMLLRQGIREFNYDGATARRLRESGDTYFAEKRTINRSLGELDVDANQLFEMVFMVGNIQPNHAGILLLFFNIISRELEADQIMKIGTLPIAEREEIRFQVSPAQDDDTVTAEIKEFFYALYLAWQLDKQLILDV